MKFHLPAGSHRKDVDIMTRIDELLAALQRKEDEKHKNTILWALAIIGAIAAVAGIAYAVYRYMTPDYLEDFEDDFDDDFDDFFEDDDEEEMEAEEPVEEEEEKAEKATEESSEEE